MFKTSLCTFTLLCLPLVGAQYGGGGGSTTSSASSTASSTTSGSASSATQSVDVGESGFVFNPDTIHVPAGGVVEFHFYPGDHSVAQAAFNNPCHPMSDTSFFSGFMASANNGNPVWSLTVNDTNPIWFYCGQVGHCAAGMVGVINPSGSDTLDAFKSAASTASGQSVPAAAQGGILGTPSASQSTAASSSNTATSSSAASSSSAAASSTSTASGTPTSAGGSSPSATNMADNFHVSTSLSVMSVIAFTMAMFLM
jgi:plastocyanin